LEENSQLTTSYDFQQSKLQWITYWRNPRTQEVVDYCAENKIYPQIQMIKPEMINETWDKVVNKEARYRYVIDMSSLK
jgi:D-arabinose 1-dehydrogenase-like Zn-dependent alcohol dehydrogenase